MKECNVVSFSVQKISIGFSDMRLFSLLLCWLCTWCESLWNAAPHLTGSRVLFTKSITPHSHTMSIYTQSEEEFNSAWLFAEWLFVKNSADRLIQTSFSHTFVFLSQWDLYIDFWDVIFYPLMLNLFPYGDLEMVFTMQVASVFTISLSHTHRQNLFIKLSMFIFICLYWPRT